MMSWYGGAWGPGQWVGMGLGMLLFWGVIIALVIALLRWTGPGHRHEHVHQQMPMAGQAPLAPPAAPAAPTPPGPSARALQILDERFAQGELTEDEYRARRTVLQER